MSIGDWLYSLTPRDVQVTPLQLVAQWQEFTFTGPTGNCIFEFPAGQFGLFRPVSIVIRAFRASGTTNVLSFFEVLSPARGEGVAGPNAIRLYRDASMAGQTGHSAVVPLNPNLLLDSRQNNGLNVRAGFDAAGDSKTMRADVVLQIIPPGNVAVGGLFLFTQTT